MNFIKGKTKVTSIVIAALTAVGLITFIMLSMLLNFTDNPAGRMTMCLIYSVTFLFGILVSKGIVDIMVFRDYKCQKKQLCTEGVLNICMGALLGVIGLLYLILGTTTQVDIRWFLAGLTLIMAV